MDKRKKEMKKLIEKRTADGVKMLLETLTRNWYDTAALLDEFEATHTEYERDQSRQYDALVAGHYALKDAIDSINNRLNKIDHEQTISKSGKRG